MNRDAIICEAYPRAALIGNPSDGYFGKTIAFVFSNFKAQVSLQPDAHISFLGNEQDQGSYVSLDHFDEQIDRYGYYGGIRLMKASVRAFVNYCRDHKISLRSAGFIMSYESNIPVRLGLAGSSAIITAVCRALCSYYDVRIPIEILANLVLSVEKDELQIMGGLQDRVAQVYNKPMLMSFEQSHMNQYGYGVYQPINSELLRNVFIIFRQNTAEGSEQVHNNLKERFDSGDQSVIHAMQQFAKLTDDYIASLRACDIKTCKQLINMNFDLRKSICPIDPNQLKLVEMIRSTGASAKFTGSGGAIIGMYENHLELEKLKSTIDHSAAQLIIPTIVNE